MRRRQYQSRIDQDANAFKNLVAESRSYGEVADKLGYKRRPNGKLSGGIYRFLKDKAEAHQVDTSHFKGRGWAKGLTKSTDHALRAMADKLTTPIGEMFVINSRCRNRTVLQKLIQLGEKQDRCEECGLSEWAGKEIRLVLHHKNQINNDNRKENLEVLCPNCHSTKH